MVICRFTVASITSFPTYASLKLQAVYSPDGHEPPEIQKEIREFFEATPSGTLEITTTPAVAHTFKAGDHYYLSLRKCEDK